MQHEANYWKQSTCQRVSRRTALGAAIAGFSLIGLSGVACGARKSGTSNASTATGVGRTGGTATPAGPPVKLTLSYDGVPNDAPLFIAKDAGIFQKHNLDVELVSIPGPPSVAALLSGQVQADNAGPGEMLNAAAGGGDIVFVAVVAPVFTFKFYARKGITSMEEMRGKKVGITSPGGSFDQSLRAALPKYNLQPDKDVTFIATGSIANVTAALISGAIDGAAILVGPDLQKVEATGLKSLFDFADLNLPNAAAAISFTRSYLNAQRNTVQAYVDSYIEGRVKFTHDKSAAIRALGEIYKTNDQAGLDLTYDYYNREKVLPTLPYPQVEALKNTADTLCKTNAKLCAFDVSKVVDPSFVKNAADRGLDKG